MLHYRQKLKLNARKLRDSATDAELLLWFRIRRKQICNIQFYRQKPIGNYIVDFYAPAAKLVIEIDGSQHVDEEHAKRDKERDSYLMALGFKVLRFDNLQVLQSINDVVEEIFRVVAARS